MEVEARRGEGAMNRGFTLALAFAALALTLAGCGHTVEPRSPYESSSAVPAPRAVSARLDVSQGIVVTWSATAADRAIVDGWLVERRATTETTFHALSATPLRDTMFVDGGVADGERVVHRVLAVTGAGVRSRGVESAPVRGDAIAPAAPAGVAVATAPGGLALTFTPGPEPDIALYEARLVRTGAGELPLFRQFTASPAFLGGLVAGAEYAVEVAALDSAGRFSPYSTPPAIGVAGAAVGSKQ
jgi:hypothetical protein